MQCETCPPGQERMAMHRVEFPDGKIFRVCSGCLAEDGNKVTPLLRVLRNV